LQEKAKEADADRSSNFENAVFFFDPLLAKP